MLFIKYTNAACLSYHTYICVVGFLATVKADHRSIHAYLYKTHFQLSTDLGNMVSTNKSITYGIASIYDKKRVYENRSLIRSFVCRLC